MRNEEGMKFDCIFEEPLDFIDIDYTHLNKTIRYEQRQYGEWIKDYEHEEHGYAPIICNRCKYSPSIKSNFCPNCGRYMRGKKNG